jgi:hypothetical protein
VDAAFLEGTWQGPAGTETWAHTDAGWVGVGLGDGGWYEILAIVDDAYVARPHGGPPVSFALMKAQADAAWWANPAHDAPKRITYRLRDGTLVAKVRGGGGGATFRFSRVLLGPRVTLPGAETALASGVAADGRVGFTILSDGVTIWTHDPTGWVVVP